MNHVTRMALQIGSRSQKTVFALLLPDLSRLELYKTSNVK